MNHTTIAIIVFFVTIASSVAFVLKTTELFNRLGLVDPPGPRRVHVTPVPRGLGVAIFLSFLIGVGVSYTLPVDRQSSETERILLMVIGCAIIVGVMLVDDAVSLGPTTKLIWQAAAASIIILPRLSGAGRGIVIEQVNFPIAGTVVLPLAIAIAVTFFWFIGIMNIMNWVDGLDGLAATVTLVACVILFIHTWFGPGEFPQFTISLLPLALMAAILGFLPFNWHPARVVMGDAGAMFLGLALAVISIIGGAKIATALLTLGLPIADGIWVISFRIIHGRSPLTADRGHLHHQLLDAGWGQRRIVMCIGGLSLLFGIGSLVLPNRELKAVLLVGVGLVLAALIAYIAARSKRLADELHTAVR